MARPLERFAEAERLYADRAREAPANAGGVTGAGRLDPE